MGSLFEKEEWLNAVALLRNKASEFEKLESAIMNTFYIASNSPELLDEYDSLLFKAEIIRNTIKTVTEGIDYVFKVFNTVFNDTDTSGLGFIPLVPIAVILAAIASITYWVNDAVKYLSKINEVKRIESEGYTVKEAYQILQDEKGFFGALLESKYLLIGSGLVLLLILTRKKDDYRL